MSRIFLVDDHAIVREGLRAVLQSHGHEIVGEAESLDGVVDALAALRPDLLLLDLMLDRQSGLELLAELQRRGDEPPTVVLTMSTHPGDVAEALRLGAAGYLRKDTPRDVLLAAIEAVLRGERFVSSELGALADRAGEPTGVEALELLSPRERQIVQMVVRGRSSASIASQLGLSPKTIETYRSRLMVKLGAADVTALVRLAVRAGLIDPALD